MHLTKTALGAALLGAAMMAQAGPTDMGDGPGTYTFSTDHDSAWYITLMPGTYDITSTVDSTGFNLTNVWFSTSKDHKSTDHNDLGNFNIAGGTMASGSLDNFVVTKPTNFFVDVNTHLGKLTDGHFNGTLTVSAVPEPASSALLLAGLGLLGLMAVRRRRL